MKCLVVGHGESYDDYDFIRQFDGLILATDVVASDLVDNDIIPDYMLFFETQQTIRVNLHEWIPESFSDEKVRDKMTLIYRLPITSALTYRIEMLKLKWDVFELNDYGDFHADNINNVGLYSVVYATDILKMDRIHLIGMDYRGLDRLGVDNTEKWIKSAKYYFNQRKLKPKIIDHSGGDFPS